MAGMKDYNLNQESRYTDAAPTTEAYQAKCQAGAQVGYAGRAPSVDEVIEKIFTYQPARLEQVPKYEAIREAAKYFAKIILKNTEYGVDRQIAILKLREAVMFANASIALDGASL